MKIGFTMYILLLLLLSYATLASAGVPDVETVNIPSVDPQEEFEIEILVKSHAEANYTVNVTLHARFQFAGNNSDMVIEGDTGSITYTGFDQDSIRFEFPMVALNDTPEGDYHMNYEVYWIGSETSFNYTLTDSGQVRVSVGEGGGEDACNTSSLLVLPFASLGIVFIYDKKRKR
jgi:hypothetical protein